MADRTGQRLGNYKLIRLLGQGSFAHVYLAEHLYLGTQAAIKILQTRLADSDLEAFHSEARTIAHLEHPHIVRVLDFTREGNVPYLVMDYAPHGTLLQRYPRGTHLHLAVTIEYIKQIADALQYAHGQRLIHRDIKPENILIGRSEEILLSDFGIAALAQSSHNQTMQKVAGTINYMAPEQIQGTPCFASDQYALGIVVYEWICGKRPFGGSFTEIATQHIFTPPQPLREIVPDLPPAIEDVVLMALAKDPQRRFASVQAFADALEQAFLSELSQLSRLKDTAAPESTSDQSLAGALSDPFLPHTQSKHRLSRRAIGAGIAGLVGVGIASGAILLRSHFSPGSVAVSPATKKPSSTPTATSTPSPLNTLHLTHTHSSSVYAVAWSPDGKSIASGDAQTVQIWDTTIGNTQLSYPISGYKLGWSPNGKYIASTDNIQTVQVWDAATGITSWGHATRVWDVAWSPDSTRIVSAGEDKTVRIWDTTTGTVLFTYRDHTTPIYAVAWSPDGKNIASSGDYSDPVVRVWDATTGNIVSISDSELFPIRALTWSPDSKYIAIAVEDGSVRVWNARTRNYLFIYAVNSRQGGIGAVAWSPDGKWIAAGKDDKTVHVFDAASGNLIDIYSGHTSSVVAVSWSPDSTLIASGGGLTVQIWQAEYRTA